MSFFLGQKPIVLEDKIEALPYKISPSEKFLLICNAGVLVNKSISFTELEMLKCLAKLVTNLDEKSKISYLSKSQENELLNWDAERIRQKLNA